MNRTKIQRDAELIRDRLGVPPNEGHAALVEARDLCNEIQYGLIWSRELLSFEDRLIVAITVCCQRSLHDKLRQLSDAALGNGLTLQSVVEVCLQTGIYAGFAVAESALEQLGASCTSAHLADSGHGEGREELAQFSELGARTRERLHGVRHADGYADPNHPFASPLYEIASSHGYGLIWNRPGLSLRQRLICALAALAGLPEANGSFRKFVQSATENGVTLAEVVEIIMQTVPYAGFPRALVNLLTLGEMYPDSDLDEAVQAIQAGIPDI